MNRIKLFILSGCAFITGLICSVAAESKLRLLIRLIFKWATNNQIHFYGKDFHFFANWYYYFVFGVSFLILGIAFSYLTFKKIIAQLILSVSIFFLSITAISSIDSYSRLITCTACDDGTLGIRLNDINYDGIVSGSLAFAVLPCAILLVRKRKSFK